MYFRAKNISRDNKVHFIKIKGLTHHEDLTTLHIYASYSSKFMKEKLIQMQEVDKSTIKVQDFIKLLSKIDRASSQESSVSTGLEKYNQLT